MIWNVVLVMRNHGVAVIGATVSDAFQELCFFEKAAGRKVGLLPFLLMSLGLISYSLLSRIFYFLTCKIIGPWVILCF